MNRVVAPGGSSRYWLTANRLGGSTLSYRASDLPKNGVDFELDQAMHSVPPGV
jgi:hypothetical protein